jgi:hypothetical protein
MILYLRRATNGYQHIPLEQQSIPVLVMGEYLAKWKPHQMVAWLQRRVDKEHKLNLPIAVALSLYQDMQQMQLVSVEQLFLAKLDQAIINYQRVDLTIIG